jgi:hypothetical protein
VSADPPPTRSDRPRPAERSRWRAPRWWTCWSLRRRSTMTSRTLEPHNRPRHRRRTRRRRPHPPMPGAWLRHWIRPRLTRLGRRLPRRRATTPLTRPGHPDSRGYYWYQPPLPPNLTSASTEIRSRIPVHRVTSSPVGDCGCQPGGPCSSVLTGTRSPVSDGWWSFAQHLTGPGYAFDVSAEPLRSNAKV